MARNPIEDWLETLGAGLIATILPLVAGWTVRLFGPPILRAFSAGGPTEDFEAGAYSLSPLVVFVCAPVVVFLFACWAAGRTRGSPLIRATIVGLGPGIALGWVIVQRDTSVLLAGSGHLKLWAILTWALLNLGPAILAGMLTVRRHEHRCGAP
jgi:Na+-driven multidrug efflux pump